jgi:hypothetical protein
MPRAPRKPRQPRPVTAPLYTVAVFTCRTCRNPATVRVWELTAEPLCLCDACYLAWAQSTAGVDGRLERLVELRG